MAPGFVEATSDMYNNITDYVLGPMHGQRAPQNPSSRPIPTPAQTPLTRCQDDSDSDDDDHHPGPSGAPLRIPVPSRSQSALLSASSLYGTTPQSPPSFVAHTSTELLPPPLSMQSSELQHQASVTLSTGASLSPKAQSASDSEPEQSPAPTAQQHGTSQQSAPPQQSSSEGQQPVHAAGSQQSSKGISGLLAVPTLLGQAAKTLGRKSLSLSYMARGVRQTLSLGGFQLPDQRAKRKPSSDSRKQQDSDSKGCDGSPEGKRHHPDGKAGNGFADGKHHHSHSKGWVESRDGQAKDGAVGQQADSKSSIPVEDGLVASLISGMFDGKQPDGKQSDGKQSDEDKQSDGKQSDDKQSDGKQSDGKQSDDKQSDDKQSDGKQSDGKQPDGKQSDGKSKNGHNDFVTSDKDRHVASKKASYIQHRFLLTYQDPLIERAYCVWQARYRTKVINLFLPPGFGQMHVH